MTRWDKLVDLALLFTIYVSLLGALIMLVTLLCPLCLVTWTFALVWILTSF